MFSEREFFTTREMLEEAEERMLAPYALRSSTAVRLIKRSPEGRIFDYRTEFQRDRDRIIYSRAFRRLRNKARIAGTPHEDHARDRFSHTIEVNQIARTIGRALKLNEDLIEAISLGHDLGTPPFGETGERILDSVLQGKYMRGIKTITAGRERFKKNRQSLRVVDFLEKRYEHEGLNLTNDTREGIVKQGEWGQNIEYANLKKEGLNLSHAPFFEAQVVRIADALATQMESLDDGLRNGEFVLKEVESLLMVRELIRKIKDRYHTLTSGYLKVATLNRGLTHLLVTNAIYHSSITLAKWSKTHSVDSAEGFSQARSKIEGDEISFSQKVDRMFEETQQFISTRLANSAYSQRASERARIVIGGLFRAYHSNPLIVDDYLLLRHRDLTGRKFLRDIPARRREKEIDQHYRKDRSFLRLITDHIAGMTDLYALEEYKKLCGNAGGRG